MAFQRQCNRKKKSEVNLSNIFGNDSPIGCPVIKEALKDKEISIACPIVKEARQLPLKNALHLSGYNYLGLKREVVICLIRMKGSYAYFVMTPMKDLISKFQANFTNKQIKNLMYYIFEHSGCYYSNSAMNEGEMKAYILWRLRNLD